MITIRRFIDFLGHGNESRKTRSASDFVSQSKPYRTVEKAATDAMSARVDATLKGGIAEVERLLRVGCVNVPASQADGLA